MLFIIYGCAFAVLGGYIVARLAPSKPMTHAWALCILMALFAVLTGYMVAYSASPSPEYVNQPDWYYPVLEITVLPSILLREWLNTRNH